MNDFDLLKRRITIDPIASGRFFSDYQTGFWERQQRLFNAPTLGGILLEEADAAQDLFSQDQRWSPEKLDEFFPDAVGIDWGGYLTIDQAQDRIDRHVKAYVNEEFIMRRDFAIETLPVDIVTGLLSSVTDPVELLAMRLPIVGPAWRSELYQKYGQGLGRVVESTIEAVAGSALIEPIFIADRLRDDVPYTPLDSAFNIGVGALAGAGIGGIRALNAKRSERRLAKAQEERRKLDEILERGEYDRLSSVDWDRAALDRLTPDQRKDMAARIAISQFAEGEEINVRGLADVDDVAEAFPELKRSRNELELKAVDAANKAGIENAASWGKAYASLVHSFHLSMFQRFGMSPKQSTDIFGDFLNVKYGGSSKSVAMLSGSDAPMKLQVGDKLVDLKAIARGPEGGAKVKELLDQAGPTAVDAMMRRASTPSLIEMSADQRIKTLNALLRSAESTAPDPNSPTFSDVASQFRRGDPVQINEQSIQVVPHSNGRQWVVEINGTAARAGDTKSNAIREALDQYRQLSESADQISAESGSGLSYRADVDRARQSLVEAEISIRRMDSEGATFNAKEIDAGLTLWKAIREYGDLHDKVNETPSMNLRLIDFINNMGGLKKSSSGVTQAYDRVTPRDGQEGVTLAKARNAAEKAGYIEAEGSVAERNDRFLLFLERDAGIGLSDPATAPPVRSKHMMRFEQLSKQVDQIDNQLNEAFKIRSGMFDNEQDLRNYLENFTNKRRNQQRQELVDQADAARRVIRGDERIRDAFGARDAIANPLNASERLALDDALVNIRQHDLNRALDAIATDAKESAEAQAGNATGASAATAADDVGRSPASGPRADAEARIAGEARDLTDRLHALAARDIRDPLTDAEFTTLREVLSRLPSEQLLSLLRRPAAVADIEVDAQQSLVSILRAADRTAAEIDLAMKLMARFSPEQIVRIAQQVFGQNIKTTKQAFAALRKGAVDKSGMGQAAIMALEDLRNPGITPQQIKPIITKLREGRYSKEDVQGMARAFGHDDPNATKAAAIKAIESAANDQFNAKLARFMDEAKRDPILSGKSPDVLQRTFIGRMSKEFDAYRVQLAEKRRLDGRGPNTLNRVGDETRLEATDTKLLAAEIANGQRMVRGLFSPDEGGLVRIYDGADPTTLKHEMAHGFLHMFLRASEKTDADPKLVESATVLKEWLGVSDYAELRTKGGVGADERFANAFTRWLADDSTRAPAPELVPIFRAFKDYVRAWLKRIVEMVKGRPKNPQGELPPAAIRNLMSEMVAPDDLYNLRKALGEMVDPEARLKRAEEAYDFEDLETPSVARVVEDSTTAKERGTDETPAQKAEEPSQVRALADLEEARLRADLEKGVENPTQGTRGERFQTVEWESSTGLTGFYSAAALAVQNAPQARMSPEQWLGYLRNQKGVKTEEIETLGLEAALQESGSRSLDKDFVMNEILLSQPRFIREVKVDDTIESLDIRVLSDELRETRNNTEFRQITIKTPDGDDFFSYERHLDNNAYGFQNKFYKTVDEVYQAASKDAFNRSREALWSKYRPEGGDNYRVVLLRMPEDIPDPYKTQHFESDEVVYLRVVDRHHAETGRILEVVEVQSDLHKHGRKDGYQQDMSAEQAILDKHDHNGLALEQRLHDDDVELFSYLEANGDPEISINAYEAFEKLRKAVSEKVMDSSPLMPNSAPRDVSKAELLNNIFDIEGLSHLKNDENFLALFSKYFDSYFNEQDFFEARERILDNSLLPPPAPFKNDASLHLGIKEAIRMAVNEDYDAISFLNANTISKAVQASDGALSRIYDKMIPRYLQKYVKPFGAEPKYRQIVEGQDSRLVVDITDKMRERLRGPADTSETPPRGQPLFQTDGEVSPAIDATTLSLPELMRQSGRYTETMIEAVADAEAADIAARHLDTVVTDVNAAILRGEMSIDEVSARIRASELSEADADDLIALYRRMLQNGDSGTARHQLTVALQGYVAQAVTDAQIRRRNARRNAEIFAAIIEDIDDMLARGVDPDLALRKRLGGINRIEEGGRVSADVIGEGGASAVFGGLYQKLSKDGLFDPLVRGDWAQDFATELHRIQVEQVRGVGVIAKTGNVKAERAAELVHETLESIRTRANMEMAWIRPFAGRVLANMHNSERLAKHGMETWVNDVIDRLDWNAISQGKPMTLAQRETFLREAYATLMTGVRRTNDGVDATDIETAFKGPSNIARRVSQHRQLIWKSGQDWLEYNEKYGQGNVMDAIFQDIESVYRATGLMTTLGSNPRAMIDVVRQHIRDNMVEKYAPHMQKLQRLNSSHINNLLSELTGDVYAVRSQRQSTIAQAGSAIRATLSTGRLGFATIAALGDPIFGFQEMRRWGMPFFRSFYQSFGNVLRGMKTVRNWGDAEYREFLDYMGIGLHGTTGRHMSTLEIGENYTRMIRGLNARYYKMIGLTQWTDGYKRGAGLMFATYLSEAGPDAMSGNRRLAAMLRSSGFDDASWRQAYALANTQINGRKMLDPRLIFDAAGKAIDDADRFELIKLGERLQQLVYDRTGFATPTPGVNERALLNQGTTAGTPIGEAMRLLTQLKTFGVTVVNKNWGASTYGDVDLNGGSGLRGFLSPHNLGTASAMFAVSAVMGTAVLAIKDILRARDPKAVEDLTFDDLIVALAQGGSLGIIGDLVLGSGRYQNSTAEALAGPGVQVGYDMLQILSTPLSNADALLDADEDFVGSTRSVADFIRNNTPIVGALTNMFYTKSLFDYGVYYQFLDILDSGALADMERGYSQFKDGRQLGVEIGGTTIIESPDRAIEPSERYSPLSGFY